MKMPRLLWLQFGIYERAVTGLEEFGNQLSCHQRLLLVRTVECSLVLCPSDLQYVAEQMSFVRRFHQLGLPTKLNHTSNRCTGRGIRPREVSLRRTRIE